MRLRIFFLCILCYYEFLTAHGYEIPPVNVELVDNGFRVWIPDEVGVQNVAFNVNRNRPFKSFEAGEFSTQLREPTGNRWVYENKRPLQDDDTLYIWTYVQYNQTRYQDVSQPITVRAIKDAANQKIKLESTTTTTGVVSGTSSGSATTPGTGACTPSITTVQGRKNICRGDLVFQDDFDGDLDVNRWRSEVRLPLDLADAEFVIYDTNAFTEDGSLNIEPRLWNDDKPGTNIRRGYINLSNRCTGTQNRRVECERQPLGQSVLPPLVSARINTKNSFSFKYGRVVIRAKLPQGDWLFPLLLLEPQHNYYGQQPYISGQMRIAFVRGNENLQTNEGERGDGYVLYGGAVLAPGAEERERYLVKTVGTAHFGDDFHVYSLTWDERGLTLMVDDESYGTISGKFLHSSAEYRAAWENGGDMAPLDQEFFITLGVAAGGHGDFPDKYTSKPWMNTSPKAALNFWRDRENWKKTWKSPSLQVDYVRVYAI